MQVSSAPMGEPTFVPFDLTFRIESQEEAEGIYFLFNHTSILKAAGLWDQSRDVIDHMQARCRNARGSFNEKRDALKTMMRS